MYFHRPISVHPDVREKFARDYPDIMKDKALLRLVEHVAFAPFAPHTETVLLPYRLLAHIEERSSEARQRKYCGQPIIDRFRAHFPECHFEEPLFTAERARSVTRSGLPEWLYEEAAESSATSGVFFASGQEVSARNLRHQRAKLRAEIQNLMANAEPSTIDIIQYFSTRRRSAYDPIIELRLEAARSAARRLPKKEARARALMALARNRVRPGSRPRTSQPLSARIPSRAWASNLFKEGRRTLFDGYHQLDLYAAQLAIIASLWGARTVQEFLHDGGSIWTHLAAAYGQPITPVAKDALKTALYALIFGAGIYTITRSLKKANLSPTPFFNSRSSQTSSPPAR
jgi:hypothetical protein